MSEFQYQDMFAQNSDATKYKCLSTDHVAVSEFNGQPMLTVEPEALSLL